MKRAIYKKLSATFIVSVLLVLRSHAQISTVVDDYVLNKMKDFHIPGLAFTLIKDGKIAMTKGYGYADFYKDIPFTPNTIQHQIASISKMVTATAVMKLWEDGLFQLDDPINNYLPFPVTNPYYPALPITFRMLLNHTSSIISEVNSSRYPGTIEPLGPYLPLGPFLQSIFPGGNRYVLSECFSNTVPGSEFHYTNVGYTLLGYLVQQISGMPFNQYCDQNIFQPLCMNHTAWFFSQVDTNVVSRPYDYMGNANHPIDLGLYESTNYPGQQVKTTVVELSKFILMHMNYGILDGVRIIDATTETMMRSYLRPATGLGAGLTLTVEGVPVDFQLEMGLGLFHFIVSGDYNKDFFGWSGSNDGVSTQSWFNTNDNTGIIVFANQQEHGGNLEIWDIALTLEKMLADTISTAAQTNLNCSWLYNPCQHDINYWTNNLSQWSFSTVPMKLGTKHYYTKNQTLALLNTPVNGDASIVLGKALVATKLNIAQGSQLSPIVLTYNAAMNAIGDKRLPYNDPVSFSSPTGVQMLALAATLDSYNSGGLNTTPCSGYPSAITKANVMNEVDRTSLLYSLSVFPNPSSGNAAISFSLEQTEKVSINVFEMSGRLVKSLSDKVFEKGEHRINWNAENITAGIYFVKMQTAGFSETKKLVVVK